MPKATSTCSLCPFSEGKHSARMGSSCAAESEAGIEIGGKKKEEDAGNIKGAEGLEMKIFTPVEKGDNHKANDYEEPNFTMKSWK